MSHVLPWDENGHFEKTKPVWETLGQTKLNRFLHLILPKGWEAIAEQISVLWSVSESVMHTGGWKVRSPKLLFPSTPKKAAHRAPLSMGFFRQDYWSGLPFPSPEDLPNPGIEPGSPTLQADSLPFEYREVRRFWTNMIYFP